MTTVDDQSRFLDERCSTRTPSTLACAPPVPPSASPPTGEHGPWPGTTMSGRSCPTTRRISSAADTDVNP